MGFKDGLAQSYGITALENVNAAWSKYAAFQSSSLTESLEQASWLTILLAEQELYMLLSFEIKKNLNKFPVLLPSRFKFKFTCWNVMQNVFDKSLLLLKTILCIGRSMVLVLASSVVS